MMAASTSSPSPSPSPSPVTFSVSHKDSELVLTVAPPLTMERLRVGLSALLSLPLRSSSSSPSFHVGYLDDEADYVRMSTDEELRLFLDDCNRRGQHSHPLLTVVNTASEAASDEEGEEDEEEGGGSDSGGFVKVEASDFRSEPASPAPLAAPAAPLVPLPPTMESKAPVQEVKAAAPLVGDGQPAAQRRSAESAASPAVQEGARQMDYPAAAAPPVASQAAAGVAQSGGSGSAAAPLPPAQPNASSSAVRRPPVVPPVAQPVAPPSSLSCSSTSSSSSSSAPLRFLFESQVFRHPLYPKLVAVAQRKLRRLTVKRLLKKSVRWMLLAVLLYAACSSYASLSKGRGGGGGVDPSSFQRLHTYAVHLGKLQHDRAHHQQRSIDQLQRDEERRVELDRLTARSLASIEQELQQLRLSQSLLQTEGTAVLLELQAQVAQQQRTISALQEELRLLQLAHHSAETEAGAARERQKARESKWGALWASPAVGEEERRKKEEEGTARGWEQRKSARTERAERREQQKLRKQQTRELQLREKEEEADLLAPFPWPADPLDEVEALYNPKQRSTLHSAPRSSSSASAAASSASASYSRSGRGAARATAGTGLLQSQREGGRAGGGDGCSRDARGTEWGDEVVDEARTAKERVGEETKKLSPHAKKKVGKKIGKAVEQVNAAAKRVWKAWENLF